MLCSQRQVLQNCLKYACISMSQQQMLVNRHSFTRRKDFIQKLLCVKVCSSLLWSLAENFRMKWRKKAASHALPLQNYFQLVVKQGQMRSGRRGLRFKLEMGLLAMNVGQERKNKCWLTWSSIKDTEKLFSLKSKKLKWVMFLYVRKKSIISISVHLKNTQRKSSTEKKSIFAAWTFHVLSLVLLFLWVVLYPVQHPYEVNKPFWSFHLYKGICLNRNTSMSPWWRLKLPWCLIQRDVVCIVLE